MPNTFACQPPAVAYDNTTFCEVVTSQRFFTRPSFVWIIVPPYTWGPFRVYYILDVTYMHTDQCFNTAGSCTLQSVALLHVYLVACK